MAGRLQHGGIFCYTLHFRSSRLILGLKSGGVDECVGLVPAGLGVYVLMCGHIHMSVCVCDPGRNAEQVVVHS